MGFMVIILAIASIGVVAIEIHEIKKVTGDVAGVAKKAIMQGIALKTIEAATGVNAKSLVKPYASDPTNNSETKQDSSLIGRGGKFIAGLGLKTAGTVRSTGEIIDGLTGKKMSGFANNVGRFAKNYVNQTKKDIKDTAGLYGDAFKQLIPEGARRSIKGFTSNVKKGFENKKRWVRQKNTEISNVWKSTKGYQMQKNGDQLIAEAFGRRHPGLALKEPTLDLLPVHLTDKGRQISNIIDKTANLNNMARSANMLNRTNDRLINTDRLKQQIADKKEISLIDEYKNIRGIKTAKDTMNAKIYAQAVKEIKGGHNQSENEYKHQIMRQLVKNSSIEMDKEKLINTTNETYKKYYNSSIASMVETKKNEGIEKAAKSSAENVMEILTGESNDIMNEDIWKNIVKKGEKLGDVDQYVELLSQKIADNPMGSEAIAYFGKEKAEKIKTQLENKQNSIIEQTIMDAKDDIASQYMKEKGMSMQQAMEHVDNLANGAFDKDKFDKVLQETINSINSGNYNSLSNITANSSGENIQVNVQNNVSTPTIQNQGQTQISTSAQQQNPELVVDSLSSQTAQSVSSQTDQPVQGQQVQQGQHTQTVTVEATSQAGASRKDASSIETSATATNVDSTKEVIKQTTVTKENVVSTVSADGNTSSIDLNTLEDITDRAAQKATAPIDEFFMRYGEGSRTEGIKKLVNTLNGGSKANLTDEIKKELAEIGLDSQEKINGLIQTMKQELNVNSKNDVMNGTNSNINVLGAENEQSAQILDFKAKKGRKGKWKATSEATSEDIFNNQEDETFKDVS